MIDKKIFELINHCAYRYHKSRDLTLAIVLDYQNDYREKYNSKNTYFYQALSKVCGEYNANKKKF